MFQTFKTGISCLFSMVFLTACSGGASLPSAVVPPPIVEMDTEVVLISDIDYGKTTHNTLDIYQPSDTCDANRPTVFFVHGGGFTSGDKVGSDSIKRSVASNAKGFNFVSINYRLVRHEPVLAPEFQAIYDEVAGPNPPRPKIANAAIAAIEDSIDALNFLVANADEYCLDMNRLAYWGSSAGSFTVLSVAYSMDEFGISRPDPGVVINYWGVLPRIMDLEFMEAPFLTIHGDADPTVDYQSAIDLADRGNATGVPFSFYTEVGGNHVVDTDQTVNGTALLDLTLNFIEAHIVGGLPLYETANVN